MNPADAKWLEILKASGWQTTALTIAFVVFIILVNTEIVPTTDSPLWVAIPTIAALICGCLALATIGDGLVRAIKPAARFEKWRRVRQDQKMVWDFIPYMTDRDRAIIGYLLHHNQKMFQHDQDGGYAASLIAKGIIRPAGRPGQVVDLLWVPFEIPDHIWAVLEENRDSFPYQPPTNTKDEKHPWAIHWMVR